MFLTLLAYISLFGTIGAEIIGFLSSYMVVNRLSSKLHDGIFQRCGAMNYYLIAVNQVGSFVSNAIDGSFTAPTGCIWWNSRMYELDESINSKSFNSFRL
jgi:hypothetical protein